MSRAAIDPAFVPSDELRARFAEAMSAMYQAEVPRYGDLLALVREVNGAILTQDPNAPDAGRLATERHGAIRLGTAGEMRLIARVFAVLGMAPVGYYDLAPAGLPVHSTAFRPITAAGLAASPFRIFTSLLRLDLIEPARLRAEAEAALGRRAIVTRQAEALIARAEQAGGLGEADGARLIDELLETFRWHAEASVSMDLHTALAASHRLVADVVSFRGPHINHLTPRVLDIDLAQARMKALGFQPKDVVEGPARRACPLLLRQTSFKALEETIGFRAADGTSLPGVHTARFGEVEQRGAALTPKGRARYDRWLAEGGTLQDALPDDWDTLRREGLAYFRYAATEARGTARGISIEDAAAGGALIATPITYEDFLPVSAAGIFRSNLGAAGPSAAAISRGDRRALENAIGAPIGDEFALYAQEERRSLEVAGLILPGTGRGPSEGWWRLSAKGSVEDLAYPG